MFAVERLIMIIVNGSNSKGLAERVASALKVPLAKVSYRKFPDGELYTRIDSDLDGEDVVLIQTMFPDQNSSLIEFLLTADLIKDSGGKKLIGIIPYFAYARQDKKFQAGEALSIKTLSKLFKSVDINELMTVDVHFHRKPGNFDFYGIPCKNLSAVKLLVDYVRKNISPKITVIGPDLGSSELLEPLKEKTTLTKKKICPVCKRPAEKCICTAKEKRYKIEIESNVDFKNQDVMILDDIISSGSTVMGAIKKVESSGAKKIIVAAVHGLFLGESLQTIKGMSDYLVTTDTIENPVSDVSVAPLITENLKQYTRKSK